MSGLEQHIVKCVKCNRALHLTTDTNSWRNDFWKYHITGMCQNTGIDKYMVQISFACNADSKLANKEVRLSVLCGIILDRRVEEIKTWTIKHYSRQSLQIGATFSDNMTAGNWLFVSNLWGRISLVAEGRGDCSLLSYLQHMSIAGKRVREENRSRLPCQFHMEAEELWKG